MRDRLWKRRVREGLAKPYIPKEEVEKEMRSPKNSKSDASDSEATTPYASNSEAETFSVAEGTISPATFPSKYKSVFPTKVNPFPDLEYQQQKSPQPSLPPLPRMLPMNNFKSGLQVVQVSNISLGIDAQHSVNRFPGAGSPFFSS